MAPVEILTIEIADWHRQAACRGMTELFFPDDSDPADVAKAVCRRCPVRIPCLDYAIANGEKYGIWGGFSERERRRLRRLRALAAVQRLRAAAS
jgi:WhiB family redox-sensing transcriptional regulator